MYKEKNFDNNVNLGMSLQKDMLKVICHKAINIALLSLMFLAAPSFSSQLDILEQEASSLTKYNDNQELTKKIASDLNHGQDKKPLLTILPKGSESSNKPLFNNEASSNDVTLAVISKNDLDKQNSEQKNKYEFVRIPKAEDFADYKIKPVEFGQDYIGLVKLTDYESYWQNRIQSLDIANKCRYFLGESSFTIYGNECIRLNSFERLEAYSDSEGNLAALLFNEKLGTAENHKHMIRALNVRYTEIDPKNTPIKDVSNLNSDLCSVMTRLAKASYRCDVKWYKYKDIYISYTFSMFKGSAKATILYASEKYLLEIEKSLLKRRLALVRQELDRNLTLNNGRISMTASN